MTTPKTANNQNVKNGDAAALCYHNQRQSFGQCQAARRFVLSGSGMAALLRSISSNVALFTIRLPDCAFELGPSGTQTTSTSEPLPGNSSKRP